jgi:hypothetical protein
MTSSEKVKRPRVARSACGSRQEVVRQATSDARRRAAAVLEVLAGARTPTQAAEALGVSLPRYYLLEPAGDRGPGSGVRACSTRAAGQCRAARGRLGTRDRALDARIGPASSVGACRAAQLGAGAARGVAAEWQTCGKGAAVCQIAPPQTPDRAGIDAGQRAIDRFRRRQLV